MQWFFIISIILLVLGCTAILVFSHREKYRLAINDITSAAEEIRNLTLSKISIYERLSALVLFYGKNISTDKKDFNIPEGAPIQDFFTANTLVDCEISILTETVLKNEALMSEKGSAIKKLCEELEKLESLLASDILIFNERVALAKRYSSHKLSKYVLTNLGDCGYNAIVFPLK